MKTWDDLKQQITPEFIKKLCEFAGGFGYIDYVLSQSSDLEQVRFNNIIFPLLIHRAVEGIKIIYSDPEKVWYNNIYGMQCFRFKNYQPEYLTQAECAMLDCLLDIFKETGGER